MTMATLMALLMGKKINLRERLIIQEAMNQLTVAGVVRLTRYIVKVTLLIEFVAGTILAIRLYQDYGAKGIYFGYWHAVSSFCNAGFDLFGGYRSLTGYTADLTVNLIISTLIVLGGIGFSVMADVLEHRRFRDYSLHSKLVLAVTAFLITFGAIVIFALEQDNPATLGALSWDGKVLASYFQSVTSRTAGFNTLAIGEMGNATLFFIVILMFIGASPGSTGGGVKTTTAGLLAAAIWALIRGKEDVEIFERSLPRTVIYKAFALVFIAALLVMLVTMISASANRSPSSTFFSKSCRPSGRSDCPPVLPRTCPSSANCGLSSRCSPAGSAR